jgi:hypothetical protein
MIGLKPRIDEDDRDRKNKQKQAGKMARECRNQKRAKRSLELDLRRVENETMRG